MRRRGEGTETGTTTGPCTAIGYLTQEPTHRPRPKLGAGDQMKRIRPQQFGARSTEPAAGTYPVCHSCVVPTLPGERPTTQRRRPEEEEARDGRDAARASQLDAKGVNRHPKTGHCDPTMRNDRVRTRTPQRHSAAHPARHRDAEFYGIQPNKVTLIDRQDIRQGTAMRSSLVSSPTR